jgi:hypothetical protein
LKSLDTKIWAGWLLLLPALLQGWSCAFSLESFGLNLIRNTRFAQLAYQQEKASK